MPPHLFVSDEAPYHGDAPRSDQGVEAGEVRRRPRGDHDRVADGYQRVDGHRVGPVEQ